VSPRLKRKRALIRVMHYRRAVGALLASVVFRIPHEKVNPMVATRDQLRERKRRLLAPRVHKVNPLIHVPAQNSTVSVGNFDVAIVSGTVVATPRSGKGAQLVFDGPSRTDARDLRDLAVRYLTRRGPGYAPAGVSQRITLDGSGRRRATERV
jgi:hypothetical protein